MAPHVIVFDLLTALLDSWSLWAEAANNDRKASYRWRTRYLELTFGCGAYRPYEDLVYESAKDAGLPDSVPKALIENWDQMRPWPETKDVLLRLKEKGYRLGVVSNCSVELGRRAVALCGVDFDAFVTAEEAGFYKPHPKAYGTILSALGVQPSDALFVAGSNGDVVGAAVAGMDVVWHNQIGLPRLPGSKPRLEGRSLHVVLDHLSQVESTSITSSRPSSRL
ncbi:HAD-like domain-containing protein [Aspergillus caelatus]|uniref:HAD-like domain-containing protein n=2 Tax=Aspergillus subgen. Circumdati TaxID=2720871 RepID=A0A5N7AML6_9EURO|nr:HAD-like domain-containing protein [Aspergillus caelatus]KAE8369950.1 HAD-like domain-containing protein [Aspergillus caelatus]KAE8419541.1 HAD-like domain-containing protein [Aspergillus pseudocaelatus]